MNLINNSKFNIKNCPSPLANASGAVLLTVVVIIIIIGLTGVAIYSLTSSSTFTQLNAQNATKAFYLAESGFRVVASEYNNATGTKNSILENLHGTSLSLAGNAGQFDVRVYPYWFYVNTTYTPLTNNIRVKMPGGIPLRNPADTSSPRITIPGSGFLKLQGKTQLATITGSALGSGDIVTFFLNPGFPYDIQTDEEIFLVYSDITTTSQSVSLNGSLDFPGSNPIAQVLPAQNGSFRVYNEINDKMDYTYQEKTPSVIDPGNPPTTITLSGIQHQEDATPSVFPFSVDNTSELYFGRNLAVISTSTVGHGSTAAKKTVQNYTDVGLDGGFSTGKDTISFEEDIADFTPTMGKSGGPLAPVDPQPIIVDTVNKQIELGQNLTGHYGSVWYKGDSDIANCIAGDCLLGRGIRAFFEFEFDNPDSSANSTTYGDGFSYAFISASNYTDGDTGAGGEYMGYAGAGLASQGLQPPKIGIEIDTYPNPGADDMCGSDSRRDDTPDANHLAAVYWGEETPGSFDATGGWLSLGTDDWSSNTDNCDPGAYCGTISFWFKRDTITYGGTSSGDRIWGQDADMEMRFSSFGTTLYLDWGTDNALSLPNPFTETDKWYFVAINWATDKEGASTDGRLRFSWGDENTLYWDAAKTEPWSPTPLEWPSGVSENLFMNSGGGDSNQGFQVDGQGTNLRYYKSEIHREADIEDLWDNTRPTAPDSYHPLQTDTIDSSTGVNASIVGSAGWSTDTPSLYDCGTGAVSYDDNRHGAGGSSAGGNPMNSLKGDPTDAADGYYPKAKVVGDPNWLEDGLPHLFRIELIRPLLDDPLGSGLYKYQFKVWILDETDLTATELAQFKDVRADFSAFSPLIQKTIKDTNNPLVLDTTNHDLLNRILFGFTQGTGGATQNITLRDLELYFLRQYPVSDLATW